MLLAAPVLLLVIFMITARLSLAYKLRQRRKRGESARTMVVLGSGGHTAEMLSLLRGFDLNIYSPRCYVVAATDKMSAQKATTFETEAASSDITSRQQDHIEASRGSEGSEPADKEVAYRRMSHRKRQPAAKMAPPLSDNLQHKQQQAKEQNFSNTGSSNEVMSKTRVLGTNRRGKGQASEQQHGRKRGQKVYRIIAIPRSREVGQSFKSSIKTTLRALRHAVRAVLRFKPDIVVVNGPGTCIPICAAAVLARWCGIAAGRVVYVESIARVYHLSLSGKILYKLRLADVFFVQWEELQQAYPRSKYAGRLM